MQTMTAAILQQKLEKTDELVLIDVREPWEHAAFNIGGILIPLNTIFENLHQIPKHIPVIIYCEKGIRSSLVIQRLEAKFNYSNLVNLEGGMNGWKKL
ncbi:MAG: rhodanese-like domain-containing protein [Ferruginibacter sp.]